ncbi:MAG: AMP-dependent synthetase/ligase [Chitinophagales bacterium]
MDLLDQFVETTPTLAHAFFNTSRYCGERPAQMFKENDEYKTITYLDFAANVEEMACGLMSLGMQKGDKIGLMAHTSAVWGWADFSILTAGGVTVTIYPSLPGEEITFIGNHAKFSLIYVADAVIAERVIEVWPELPELKKMIVLDPAYQSARTDVINIDKLKELGRIYKSNYPDAYTERWSGIKPEDPSSIIYTSGTTGALKGSMLTHRDLVGALVRSLKHMRDGGYSCSYNDVAFSILPLAHIWERNNSYLAMISCGGCIGYAEKPSTLLQDIQYIKPTWALLVPRLWDRIFNGIRSLLTSTPEGKQRFENAMQVGYEVLEKRTGPNGALDLMKDPTDCLDDELKIKFAEADSSIFSVFRNVLGGRLRIPYSGGALLPPDLHRSFLAVNFPLLNGWGLTETAAGISHGYPNATKVGWLSKIVPGVEARLDDDGEVLVRGTGIIREYYDNPEETAVSFTSDGWFRTGDIGEFDSDGFLRIIDRKKSIMVLDTGKNVAPARIETRFTGSPVVEQVVTVGDGRKFVTALIVPAYDYIIYIMKERQIPVDESQLVYANLNGIDTCVQVGPDVASHPLTYDLVQKEVQKVNEQLADFETIKKFAILPRKFTEITGELTPTLKIKNRVVFANFQKEIEELYGN